MRWRWPLTVMCLLALGACGDSTPMPQPASTTVTSIAGSDGSAATVTSQDTPASVELATDDQELIAVVEELEQLEADLAELEVLEELVDPDAGG